MEFEVKLNSVDVIKALAYSHVRNISVWVMCFVASISVNLLGFAELWAFEWPLRKVFYFLGGVVFWFFGLFLLGLVLTSLLLLLNPSWRKGRVGLHMLEINGKGVVESTEYNRSEIYWSSIHYVSSRSGGLYFLHSGADSFFIPKRSFKSPECWQVFERQFFEYYQRSMKT